MSSAQKMTAKMPNKFFANLEGTALAVFHKNPTINVELFKQILLNSIWQQYYIHCLTYKDLKLYTNRTE